MILRWLRRRKIFFIGFNKCGTTALHNFLKKNGVRSLHYQDRGRYVAAIIEQNLIRGRDPLYTIERYEAFSDLILVSESCYVEGNQYFEQLHACYPDSYFIFNDRDLGKWILSRLKHKDFADRQARYFGVTKDELPGIWRSIYGKRKQEIEAFFCDRGRFLNFNIESDDIQKIAEFLRPDFQLKTKHFTKVNVTKSRQA